jgi:hypothetical protein
MLEFLMLTPDDDNECPLIRNEDTLRRRAWIDRALSGVRARLKPDELGELPVAAQPAVSVQPGLPVSPVVSADQGGGSRPRLFVVRNRTAAD